jgi:hypothetical protein
MIRQELDKVTTVLETFTGAVECIPVKMCLNGSELTQTRTISVDFLL